MQDREYYARRKDRLREKRRYYDSAGSLQSFVEHYDSGSAYGIRTLWQFFSVNGDGESVLVRQVRLALSLSAGPPGCTVSGGPRPLHTLSFLACTARGRTVSDAQCPPCAQCVSQVTRAHCIWRPVPHASVIWQLPRRHPDAVDKSAALPWSVVKRTSSFLPALRLAIWHLCRFHQNSRGVIICPRAPYMLPPVLHSVAVQLLRPVA